MKRSLLAQEDRFPAYGSRPIFLCLRAYGACPMAPCVHEDQTTASAHATDQEGALQLKVQPQGVLEVDHEVGWHSAKDRTDPVNAD